MNLSSRPANPIRAGPRAPAVLREGFEPTRLVRLYQRYNLVKAKIVHQVCQFLHQIRVLFFDLLNQIHDRRSIGSRGHLKQFGQKILWKR